MKKFLFLILAIASVCAILVSCDDDILAQAEEALVEFDYDVEELEEVVTVDFYIISGEKSSAEANHTVNTRLSENFKRDYNTSVQMHYITESQYRETVLNDHQTVTEGKVSVVLVNSEELYNELRAKGVLCNLASLYDSKKYNYGTLKKQLSALLPLTKTTTEDDVPVLTPDGKEQYDANGVLITEKKEVDAYFAVPNNHIFGTYTYTLINKELALAYNVPNDAKNCKTAEDVAALIAKLQGNNFTAEQIDALIDEEKTGHYGDIVEASKDNYFVITAEPVATAADVFSSAFVIAGDKNLAERAMRIIYAINTVASYRNLLQYGVLGSNYTQQTINGINYVYPAYLTSDSPSTSYEMYLKYTGDILLADNCAGICAICSPGSDCENKCLENGHSGDCDVCVMWEHDNAATCNTWIDYELNGGEFADGFEPIYGLTNGYILLDTYIPVKESSTVVEDGVTYEVKYEFAGWYSHAAMTDRDLIKEVKTASEKRAVTIYAKWNEVKTPVAAE